MGGSKVYKVWVVEVIRVVEVGYSTRAHGIRPNCVNGIRHK